MAADDPFSGHDLLIEAAAAGRQWHERCQSAFGGASTEEILLDSDAFLDTLEGIVSRWAKHTASSAAHAAVTSALSDLQTRMAELVSALETGDFERVRIASQAAGLGVERIEELKAELAG